jgi:exosortase A-associated hydrolase 1/exosortase A-associated hydrolase 2
MPLPRHAHADPFFLTTATGTRFCLFHPPVGECRGALVYVPPFGEEMNKARRMAALQSRALAARGVGVLQLDLHGCGDSSGEFGDARWETWKQDIGAACAWLGERLDRPVGLWGLRLGALLALDYARSAPHRPECLLLWQPVTNGATFMTQFLRLRIAGDLLRETAEGGGTEALRATLRAGETLQIAGYDLAPALAHAIDSADAATLAITGCPVHWFELAAAPERPLPPAAARVAVGWREQDVDLHVHIVAGQPFWMTQEITECGALLAATSAVFGDAAPDAPAPRALAAPLPPAFRHERGLAFACDEAWLYGVLTTPAQPRQRGVLVVVGGPQYRAGSHRQFTLLARELAAAGIPAMRFDYRGMGDSEGAPRDFETVGDDLRAALDAFFAQVPGMDEVVLWGLCDGASAAAMYARTDRRVGGLVLLNPWVRTETGAARATIKHYYRDRLLDAGLWMKIARGQFDYRGAATSFATVAGAAFGRKAEASVSGDGDGDKPALPDRMYDALRRFDGPVLLMLSGADLTAQEFSHLSAASREWGGLLAAPRFTHKTLPKADHTCSRREWQDQVSGWTRDWLGSW